MVFLNVWRKEEPYCFSSKKLLQSILYCRYNLIISNLVLTELYIHTNIPEDVLWEEKFKPFNMRRKLKIFYVSKSIEQEAIELLKNCESHKPDIIHALMAKKYNAVLVTRENALIRDARNIIHVRAEKPERLI